LVGHATLSVPQAPAATSRDSVASVAAEG
jgi:hypothetical protein